MSAKEHHIQTGVDRLTERIFKVKAVEDAINQLLDFFQEATHLRVKNKPFKLELEDRYRDYE